MVELFLLDPDLENSESALLFRRCASLLPSSPNSGKASHESTNELGCKAVRGGQAVVEVRKEEPQRAKKEEKRAAVGERRKERAAGLERETEREQEKARDREEQEQEQERSREREEKSEAGGG